MNLRRSRSHASYAVAGMLALAIAGHVHDVSAQANKLPSGDPCTVVPLSEVQRAFPGAKAGVRDTGKQKYGVTECDWKDASGAIVFGVQELYGKDSAMEEARGLGFALGGGKPANVRYEILAGVGLGNEAVAFVEPTDAKRGVVTAGAMLAMHRGDRTLWLTSPTLPQRDRAAALKALETLGRIAVKRLD